MWGQVPHYCVFHSEFVLTAGTIKTQCGVVTTLQLSRVQTCPSYYDRERDCLILVPPGAAFVSVLGLWDCR